MLPDMDGMDVIRQLRSAKVATPVLILSGLTEAEKKVQGFGVGADDYLTKPFNREELVARIQAIVRRSKGHAQPKVGVGRLTVNLEARTAEVDNQPLHLTGKEYGILELLALRKGTTLTKEQFLNHLYGGMDEPELKIIDVFICKLRKKLATATGGESYIETVWGRGYVLRETEESRSRGRRRRPPPAEHRKFSATKTAGPQAPPFLFGRDALCHVEPMSMSFHENLSRDDDRADGVGPLLRPGDGRVLRADRLAAAAAWLHMAPDAALDQALAIAAAVFGPCLASCPRPFARAP